VFGIEDVVEVDVAGAMRQLVFVGAGQQQQVLDQFAHPTSLGNQRLVDQRGIEHLGTLVSEVEGRADRGQRTAQLV
jgi:hypothetical protein